MRAGGSETAARTTPSPRSQSAPSGSVARVPRGRPSAPDLDRDPSHAARWVDSECRNHDEKHAAAATAPRDPRGRSPATPVDGERFGGAPLGSRPRSPSSSTSSKAAATVARSTSEETRAAAERGPRPRPARRAAFPRRRRASDPEAGPGGECLGGRCRSARAPPDPGTPRRRAGGRSDRRMSRGWQLRRCPAGQSARRSPGPRARFGKGAAASRRRRRSGGRARRRSRTR